MKWLFTFLLIKEHAHIALSSFLSSHFYFPFCLPNSWLLECHNLWHSYKTTNPFFIIIFAYSIWLISYFCSFLHTGVDIHTNPDPATIQFVHLNTCFISLVFFALNISEQALYSPGIYFICNYLFTFMYFVYFVHYYKLCQNTECRTITYGSRNWNSSPFWNLVHRKPSPLCSNLSYPSKFQHYQNLRLSGRRFGYTVLELKITKYQMYGRYSKISQLWKKCWEFYHLIKILGFQTLHSQISPLVLIY